MSSSSSSSSSTARRGRSVLLALLLSIGVAGCASAAGPHTMPADPFACGMVVAPTLGVIGADLVISRPAADPAQCTTLAPGTTDDPVADDACILPRAAVTIGFDPRELEPVMILNTEVPTPELPLTELAQDSFAQAGPGEGELTLVIYGSSCAARPTHFLRTAPSNRLTIVSAEIVPAGEGCDAMAVPWTTVIEVPAGFEGYSSVTVDNVGAFVLTR